MRYLAGVDNIIGGLGNDILTDSAGDDDIKGGDGNDAISSGPGFDLNQGGRGHDFILGFTDPKVNLGGAGNDLIRGGDSADEAHGDDGDDWLEGGAQGDNLEGDSGLPILVGVDVNTPGDDVLVGEGGDDRTFGEGGDDISVAGPGFDRFLGQFGFDWVTHYNDPQPAFSDFANNAFAAPGVIFVDRFAGNEALSGWDFDDDLRGDDLVALDLVGHELDAAGIANITGLAGILPPGTTSFSAGNILLGGRGSDLLEGRGGDDIIDGDAWLTVQLLAPIPAGGTQLVDSMLALQSDVLAGLIDPGDISIVRSIETATCTCEDTAIFSGPRADYDISTTAASTMVDHARGDGLSLNPLLDNGTDTLMNVEFAQFADQTIALDPANLATQTVFFSTTAQTTLPDVGVVNDEDIVSFDPTSGVFAMVFDGSDVGLAGADIDALSFVDADTILMSFDSARTVPGIPGTVDDSDIVQFDATTLGATTAGAFSAFFDGSLVGLTAASEDIDALELLADGSLLISTIDNPSVAGVAGDTEQDLLQFTPNVAGVYSAGTWSMYFDGSDVGLGSGSEIVKGAFVDGPDLFLTTNGNFSVAGLTGADEDIFSCDGHVPGTTTTCTGFMMFVDGSAVGIPGGADIDGIDLLGEPGPPVVPTLSIDDVSVLEGDVGTTPLDFTVTLSSAPAGPISVQVDTVDISADAGIDYTAVAALVLSWSPGDPLAQTVTVNVSGDIDLEANETFFANLSAAAGATIADGQGLGTILDDDATTPSTLSVDDVALLEGDAGTTAFDFAVTLSSDPAGPVSVQVDTADGLATAGADYTAVAALVLDWLPGDPLTQTVTVDVSGDIDPEADETFFVNLSAASGATVADGQGLGTILNDDVAPPPPGGELVLFSATGTTTLPGIGAVDDEDIVSFDPVSGLFAMVFDGSDVGLGSGDVDAFAFVDADTILMSFDSPRSVPGVGGTVDDSDIVQFDATTLGATTSGVFSAFFDGSLVGLTSASEDIDALELLADGSLLISTIDNPSVAGVAGAAEQDLLRFTPTVPGVYSAGTWSMYFDGSDVGLGSGSEVVKGAFLSGADLFLTTISSFSVAGLSGANEDIFSCNGHVPGTTTTCTGFTMFVDGTAVGMPGGANVDGIDRISVAP